MKTCIFGILGGLMLGFATGVAVAPHTTSFDRTLIERCKALQAAREELDPETRAWLAGQIETNEYLRVKWDIIHTLARLGRHD